MSKIGGINTKSKGKKFCGQTFLIKKVFLLNNAKHDIKNNIKKYQNSGL